MPIVFLFARPRRWNQEFSLFWRQQANGLADPLVPSGATRQGVCLVVGSDPVSGKKPGCGGLHSLLVGVAIASEQNFQRSWLNSVDCVAVGLQLADNKPVKPGSFVVFAGFTQEAAHFAERTGQNRGFDDDHARAEHENLVADLIGQLLQPVGPVGQRSVWRCLVGHSYATGLPGDPAARR